MSLSWAIPFCRYLMGPMILFDIQERDEFLYTCYDYIELYDGPVVNESMLQVSDPELLSLPDITSNKHLCRHFTTFAINPLGQYWYHWLSVTLLLIIILRIKTFLPSLFWCRKFACPYKFIWPYFKHTSQKALRYHKTSPPPYRTRIQSFPCTSFRGGSCIKMHKICFFLIHLVTGQGILNNGRFQMINDIGCPLVILHY